MFSGFGIYGTAVEVAAVLWFFYLGFLVKKIVREQQETNRLLSNLGSAGPFKATDKAA
jgi:hypothetical protein